MVYAAPSVPPFIMQQPDMRDAIVSPHADAPTAERKLTIEGFQVIERLKQTAEDVESKIETLLDSILHNKDRVEAEQEQMDRPHLPIPPHHPPVEIDLSHLTINEILHEALLDHHGDDDGRHPCAGRRQGSSDAEREDFLFKMVVERPRAKDLPLHKLAWAVNFSSEAKKALDKGRHRRRHLMKQLNDDDDGFAELLRTPHLEPDHWPMPHPFMGGGLYQKHQTGRSVMTEPHIESEFHDSDKDHDKDRGRRREVFAKIIAYVLRYHTLPSVESGSDLVDRSTVATGIESSRLKVEGALALFPHPYPTVKFNGYAYKKGPTIKAKNGLIHMLGAPLFPPLSPVNQAFLSPYFYSTLTSDLQKVGLSEALVPHMHYGGDQEFMTGDFDLEDLSLEIAKEHSGKDAPTFTVFAPGNLAFDKLGPKVLGFLHLPFPLSKRILKYILSYHVVPDIAFFSDHIQNDTKLESAVVAREVDVEVPHDWLLPEDRRSTQSPGIWSWPPPKMPRPRFPGRPSRSPPPPDAPTSDWPPHRDQPPHHPKHNANVTHYKLPTVLSASGQNENATLSVAVVEYRSWGTGHIKRSIVVFPAQHEDDHEGHRRDPDSFMTCDLKPVRVAYTDIPARNGAIQHLTQVLRPPMPHRYGEHHRDGLYGRVGEQKLDVEPWLARRLFA
ncbi:hypothetical protein OIO90_006346 [Microbotryomycetes sp. JL221]|nr:hypothetical protein OIO90_006346 [Microbotryomycetes sp. JL221]